MIGPRGWNIAAEEAFKMLRGWVGPDKTKPMRYPAAPAPTQPPPGPIPGITPDEADAFTQALEDQ